MVTGVPERYAGPKFDSQGHLTMTNLQRGPARRRRRDGLYSIGALAQELGVTPRAIRLYEERGLLSPEVRRGWRVFNEDDKQRLEQIVKARAFGFSLSEIRDALSREKPEEAGSGWLTLSQVDDQLRHLKDRLAGVDLAITELRTLRAELGAYSQCTLP